LFRNLSLTVAKYPLVLDLKSVGISGNERADTAAKAALSLSVTPMKLTASEFFHVLTT